MRLRKMEARLLGTRLGRPQVNSIVGAAFLYGLLTADSGIFVDKAMDLIPSPEPSDSQMQDFFDQTAKLALKYGLTSIHDAATDARSIAFYRRYVFYQPCTCF